MAKLPRKYKVGRGEVRFWELTYTDSMVCMTNVKRITNKTKRTTHYPNISSAIHPVSQQFLPNARPSYLPMS